MRKGLISFRKKTEECHVLMTRFSSILSLIFFLVFSAFSFAEEKGRLSASDLSPGASDAFFFSNSTGSDTQCDSGSGVDCCDGTLEETYAGVTKFSTNYCKGRYNGKNSSTRYGVRFDTFHMFRSILNENQLVLVNSNAGCTSGDCCPVSGTKTYNWLLVRARPFDSFSSPMDMSLDTTYVGGTVTYDHSQTIKWSGTSKFSLNTLDAATQTDSTPYGARIFGTSSCTAGEFRADSVKDFTSANRPLGTYGYWIFGKNVAFYRQISGDPLIAVGFPRPTTSLSASGKMAEKNRQVFVGNYTGFTTRGVQVQRNVMLIPDTAGTTFTISEVANPSDPFTVTTLGTLACTNLDEPSQGFCRGSLTLTAVPGFSGKATCMMAYDISNRDLILCNAQNPSADGNHRRALVTIAAVSSHKSLLTLTATPVHLNANTSSGQFCATLENMTSRAVSTLSLTGNLSGDFSAVSLSGTVTAPFSGLGGTVPSCGTSLPAFSKCKLCSTATLATQKVSAHALTVSYEDTSSSTKSISETAIATRGVNSLQYETGKVTQNKTPSMKAVFANGTTQNIDAIRDKKQCSGICTSMTGSRELAYTLEGLSNISANSTLTVTTNEAVCFDAEDEDSDGTTDCFDSDCDSERGDISNASLLCNYQSERDCADAFDNDFDGYLDCYDPDCSASCTPTSVSGTAGNAQVALTWTAPSSNGGNAITDYVIQYSSNSGSTWTTFADGTSTSTSATVTGLTNGTAYIFQVAAVSAAGTGSYSAVSSSVTPTFCPTNYVMVAANATLGTSEFCVAKYEMKNVGNVATSQASGTPWVSIPRDTSNGITGAIPRCQALGAKYDLISNAQWQAMAREIETAQSPAGTYLNWSNNSTSGTNAINRGQSDNSPGNTLAASTDNDPCSGTGNSNCATNSHSAFTQKRTHTLDSGEIIWDVAGNVWEWVKENNTSAQAPNGYVSLASSWDATDKLNYGPEGTYSSKNSGEYGGLGYGWLNYSVGAVLRGGAWNSEEESGVFAAGLGYGPTARLVNLGFRCVYSNTPSAPTAVAGTSSNAQVSLTWTAPVSYGESAITDYVIQYSSDSGSTW
ncbi:MAG: hypothetical protein EBQ92_14225, partial [Proteobacteria bacterium]|nr:hypothetical protein [Pseudomonadota bacterium]